MLKLFLSDAIAFLLGWNLMLFGLNLGRLIQYYCYGLGTGGPYTILVLFASSTAIVLMYTALRCRGSIS